MLNLGTAGMGQLVKNRRLKFQAFHLIIVIFFQHVICTLLHYVTLHTSLMIQIGTADITLIKFC